MYGAGMGTEEKDPWKRSTEFLSEFNSELRESPRLTAAIEEQSKALAGQMQQVADAAITFGVSLASGDTEGAFKALGEQVSRILVSYSITAAAAAATAQKWTESIFWLGMAGVGVIGAIGFGSSPKTGEIGSGGSAAAAGNTQTFAPTREVVVNSNLYLDGETAARTVTRHQVAW